MSSKEDDENPFEPPADASDSPTEEGLTQFTGKQIWGRFFVDAISLLLSSLAAFYLRFGIPWGNSVALLVELYLRFSLVLTLATLAGFWMLGAYWEAQLNKSLRPVLSIVICAILVEIIASKYLWLRDFGRIPRSALLITVVFSIVFVTATRRFIRFS